MTSEPRSAGRARVEASFFDALYEESEDPWRFASSAYERAKYAHTVAALDGRRFDRALEVGCSIGVFTAALADVAGEVLAIDVSERALERARRRLSGDEHVRFARMAFPEQPGDDDGWDLVVCAEVLYYLDPPAFDLALRRLDRWLEDGATVLAVHWRGPTRTYPLSGDAVHDRLAHALGRWHALDGRRPQYRLDRFDGRA
jgi:predicted TPR repeat methyltransferase